MRTHNNQWTPCASTSPGCICPPRLAATRTSRATVVAGPRRPQKMGCARAQASPSSRRPAPSRPSSRRSGPSCQTSQSSTQSSKPTSPSLSKPPTSSASRTKSQQLQQPNQQPQHPTAKTAASMTSSSLVPSHYPSSMTSTTGNSFSVWEASPTPSLKSKSTSKASGKSTRRPTLKPKT